MPDVEDIEEPDDPNMTWPLLSKEDQVAMQDITYRLRGIYAVPIVDGAGLLNGGNTAVRTMPSTPIQKEAAELIESLRRDVEALQNAMEKALLCWPNDRNSAPVIYQGDVGKFWLETLKGDKWPKCHPGPYSTKVLAVMAFLDSVEAP